MTEIALTDCQDWTAYLITDYTVLIYGDFKFRCFFRYRFIFGQC